MYPRSNKGPGLFSLGLRPSPDSIHFDSVSGSGIYPGRVRVSDQILLLSGSGFNLF